MTQLSLGAQIVLFTGDISPDGRLQFSERGTPDEHAAIGAELVAAGYAEPIPAGPGFSLWRTDDDGGSLALRLTQAGWKAHEAIDLCELAIAEESEHLLGRRED